MNRIDIQNSSYADCPIRMILSRISDKWSILTLFTLTQGNHSIFRHDDFIGCFSADKIKKSVRK